MTAGIARSFFSLHCLSGSSHDLRIVAPTAELNLTRHRHLASIPDWSDWVDSRTMNHEKTLPTCSRVLLRTGRGTFPATRGSSASRVAKKRDIRDYAMGTMALAAGSGSGSVFA
jgi:hypothetical protein